MFEKKNFTHLNSPLSRSIIQVPTVLSTTIMKVQTTVFVGNISEKASDTLVRQILLVSW